MKTTGLRGLVVDDDDGTRFVLCGALENMGFDVVAADDGAAVPDLIAGSRFDLVVMDLYMPGMNGFELLRQIRRPHAGFLPLPRTPPDVRVLVVSGEGHQASIAHAEALGADRYLVKPVDVDFFEQTVRGLLAPQPASRGTSPGRGPRPRKPMVSR
jgi:CheY-like chemotaxis protein